MKRQKRVNGLKGNGVRPLGRRMQKPVTPPDRRYPVAELPALTAEAALARIATAYRETAHGTVVPLRMHEMIDLARTICDRIGMSYAVPVPQREPAE